MFRFLLLVSLLAASALGYATTYHHRPLVGHKERQKLRYHIENLYNGTPIDHPASPAVIEISLTCHGDLKLDVSAPFYSSPHPEESRLHPECPNMPVWGLWEYEMIELHFLNDDDEYFDIRLSPHGQYMGFLYEGARNQILTHVPEHHLQVEVHNPCLTPDGLDVVPDCHEPWSATTIISRNYLPPNVTKFNAHYIHGKDWGVPKPKPEDTVYESLYPQGPDAEKPNFHDLSTFQPINLTKLGYIDLEMYSPIWLHAMGKIDIQNWNPIVHDSKCNYETTSDQYSAYVDLKRDTKEEEIAVTVAVMDKEEFKSVIPEAVMTAGPTSKLGTKSESVWINFQCKGGNYLRIGVNPKGAYNAEYVPAEGDMAHGEKRTEMKLKSGVECTEGKGADWECNFKIPFDLLPPRTEEYYLQVLHFHKVKTEAGDVKTFDGAMCPSFEEGKEFCWKGCSIDKRSFGPFDEKAKDKDVDM